MLTELVFSGLAVLVFWMALRIIIIGGLNSEEAEHERRMEEWRATLATHPAVPPPPPPSIKRFG